MGPEKPISSEEARARAERNRQEALLRLQRNQSLKNRSVPSQLLNTIRPNLTTQPNLMNVSQVKASLPRYINILLEVLIYWYLSGLNWSVFMI